VTPPRRIPIAVPTVGEAEWHALREPIETGWLTQGPKVAEFEKRFAARHDVAHGVAVTSCTTGLHLALAALGIGVGDEVIVPAFTWVATANAVLYCGATPVFADVDLDTYNLDPVGVARALSPRTRAVIAVHLFGLCADVDAIAAVVPERVAIVEDAACAVGATYHGRAAGSLGAAGVFSFHPRKIITTGEGGMVVTDGDDLAARARVLRNHGATVSEEERHHGPRPYLLPEFEEMGFNYRMTDLQGALGLAQLERLDGLLDARRTMATGLATALADFAWLSMPTAPEGYDHSWQAFVAIVNDGAPLMRNELMERLEARGVSTRPGTHAVTDLTFYRKNFGTTADSFPNAHRLAEQTIALPLHNSMSDDDYAYVIDCLRDV
jgi:perosamine synthetase